jgi:hypothetical protein
MWLRTGKVQPAERFDLLWLEASPTLRPNLSLAVGLAGCGWSPQHGLHMEDIQCVVEASGCVGKKGVSKTVGASRKERVSQKLRFSRRFRN